MEGIGAALLLVLIGFIAFKIFNWQKNTEKAEMLLKKVGINFKLEQNEKVSET